MFITGGEVQNCNSRYGAFKGDELLVNVQGYANTHILRSFQFLLMVNIYYFLHLKFYNIIFIYLINNKDKTDNIIFLYL